jgi:hypothetical protein
MSSLHSLSILEDGSAYSVAKDESSEPATVPEIVNENTDSIYIWPLVFFGFLSALIVAYLLCRLPQARTLSWAMLFLQSAEYVALTAAAGIVGTCSLWSFLTMKPSLGLDLLCLNATINWIFLPCIVLLDRQHSVWILPAAILSTIATATCFKRLFPNAIETVQEDIEYMPASGMPVFCSLPVVDHERRRALWMSLCVQAAILLLLAGMIVAASILLSICTFLLTWRLSAPSIGAPGRKTKRYLGLRLTLLSILAVFATSLTLVPWLGSGYLAASLRGLFSWGNVLHTRAISSPRPNAGTDKSGYISIILWPPPKKKTKITNPPPHVQSYGAWNMSKPLVILFDGPYWYFKAPDKRPGVKAHVVHGKPALVNIHSTDWRPLLMEAHQNLDSPIDLDCCRAIDIAITNSDTRPGRIAIGVILRDSMSPGKPTKYLGEKPVVSSEPADFNMNRPPVKEVLRFSISQSGKLHQFNEITVVFLPAHERSLGGAKVSIRQFTLLPR